MYRKKPVVIEAVRFAGLESSESLPLEVVNFLGRQTISSIEKGGLVIHTLEGQMRADPGDWIIRGVKGELYPCKPDIFYATYDPVVE